jgi:hypothetical protein
MRRLFVLSAGWLAATVVAIAVAWQGVGFVGREVTGQRPSALSAREVQAQLGATTTTAPGADAATTPTTTAPSRQPTTTVIGSGRPGAPTTTTVVAPRSSPSPTTTVPRAAEPAASATTTTTTVQTAPTETRTYNTVGGTAVIRFEPGKVSVVSANPKAGFDYEPEQSSPSELRVRFRSDTHESRINAKWEGGPVDSVEEKPR